VFKKYDRWKSGSRRAFWGLPPPVSMHIWWSFWFRMFPKHCQIFTQRCWMFHKRCQMFPKRCQMIPKRQNSFWGHPPPASTFPQLVNLLMLNAP
jgi:hypothetical protein